MAFNKKNYYNKFKNLKIGECDLDTNGIVSWDCRDKQFTAYSTLASGNTRGFMSWKSSSISGKQANFHLIPRRFFL